VISYIEHRESLRTLLKENPEQLSAAVVLGMLEGNVPRALITAVEVKPVFRALRQPGA